jgi:superfamily I DNA/RNA helicase
MTARRKKINSQSTTWKKFPSKKKEPKPRQGRQVATWSAQQEVFYNACTKLDSNIALEARAGAGKTSSAVEACYRILEVNPSKQIAFVAYNKSIADELTQRAPEGVYVSTVHSLGFKCVSKYWNSFGRLTIGDTYVRKYAEAFWGPEPETAEDRQIYCQIVSMSKTRLASSAEDIKEVMNTFGFIPTCREDEMISNIEKSLIEMAKHPGTGQGNSAEISFDDMVWLPVINHWKPQPTFDVVFVDESQDLSPARAALIKSAIKRNGNIIIVGDPRQAIYSWAGASTDSFDSLVKEFNAQVLPLTATRRCAKAIVKEANVYVPDLEALPSASEGEIIDDIEFNNIPDLLEPGNAVISRTNAPLVKLFFRLVKKHSNTGRKVCLLGRDFGTRLSARIKSWKKTFEKKGNKFTVVDLLESNDAWVEKEKERIERRGGSPEIIIDQSEAIEALCIDLNNPISTTAAVDEVLLRCEAFADQPNDINAIVLTSTHKAKGLEWNKVYMLEDTYMPGWSKNKTEEENLVYVATTRAKNILVYVYGAKKSKKDAED